MTADDSPAWYAAHYGVQRLGRQPPVQGVDPWPPTGTNRAFCPRLDSRLG